MKADCSTCIADARLTIHGRGATTGEAFLEAAQRLKAQVEQLSVEDLADLLGSAGESCPGIDPPTEDDFGELDWTWECAPRTLASRPVFCLAPLRPREQTRPLPSAALFGSGERRHPSSYRRSPEERSRRAWDTTSTASGTLPNRTTPLKRWTWGRPLRARTSAKWAAALASGHSSTAPDRGPGATPPGGNLV